MKKYLCLSVLIILLIVPTASYARTGGFGSGDLDTFVTGNTQQLASCGTSLTCHTVGTGTMTMTVNNTTPQTDGFVEIIVTSTPLAIDAGSLIGIVLMNDTCPGRNQTTQTCSAVSIENVLVGFMIDQPTDGFNYQETTATSLTQSWNLSVPPTAGNYTVYAEARYEGTGAGNDPKYISLNTTIEVLQRTVFGGIDNLKARDGGIYPINSTITLYAQGINSTGGVFINDGEINMTLFASNHSVIIDNVQLMHIPGSEGWYHIDITSVLTEDTYLAAFSAFLNSNQRVYDGISFQILDTGNASHIARNVWTFTEKIQRRSNMIPVTIFLLFVVVGIGFMMLRFFLAFSPLIPMQTKAVSSLMSALFCITSGLHAFELSQVTGPVEWIFNLHTIGSVMVFVGIIMVVAFMMDIFEYFSQRTQESNLKNA